jgi:hypothetical protein
MVSRHKVRSVAVLLGMGQLLAGCGAGLEEAPPSAQALASGEQALVSSCTDSGVSLAQPDGAAVNFYYPGCGLGVSAAASVDSTYDQPLCPHQFVTEVRAVNNRPFIAFAEMILADNVEMTRSVCEGQAITATAWGYSGGTWTEVGSLSTTGIWHESGCDVGGSCYSSRCELYFMFTSGSGYSKVRVAGFAAALGIFKGRVRTGVLAAPGACSVPDEPRDGEAGAALARGQHGAHAPGQHLE